jgi:arylformamidase
MPYILSPIIKESFEGMWFEGSPYKKELIYDINSTDPKTPPVNYSAYTLKPHSLPHVETAAHTQKDGKTVDFYFKEKVFSHFFGKTTVIKLQGNNFKAYESIDGIKVWNISKDEIISSLKEITGKTEVPERLIITLEDIPLNAFGLHDPNFVLILSQDAANYLADGGIKIYGTSWKSSDFMPGSKERPIHNTLFKSALIMECLDLKEVPAGNYFMNAFPIPLEGSSESPVCPILYTKEEILKEL